MAKFSVPRSGVVLISKFKFQNFSSLRSASSKYPASKISDSCVSDNFNFAFKASYSVLYPVKCDFGVFSLVRAVSNIFLRPFNLKN